MEQPFQELANKLLQNPNDLSVIEGLEKGYTDQKRFEELLRVYEYLTRQLQEQPIAMIGLLNKAATLSSEQLGLKQRAEHYLKRIVDIDPTNVDALGGLKQLSMDTGDFEQAVLYLERQLARFEDPVQQAEGYLELGNLYKDVLQKPDKAITAFSRAHRCDPQNISAIRMLSDTYIQEERYEQMATYLIQEFIVEGGQPETLARIEKGVELLLPRPINHYLAKKLLSSLKDAGIDDPNITAIGQRITEEQTTWQETVNQLHQQATEAMENDPAQAAQIYVAIAEYLLIYGENPKNAEQWLDQCFAIWPANPLALEVLEKIYSQQNRWQELAAKLESMAAFSPSPQASARLLNNAAMIFTIRAADPDSTARIYTRILQIDPANKTAATALSEYYRERGQWDECINVLHFWAEKATTAEDKVSAYYSMCRILEDELNDQQRAISYYQHILQLDPEHAGAAKSLEPVYRQLQDYNGLAMCLLSLAKNSTGDKYIAYLNELAELYVSQLSDKASAILTYGEIVKAAPSQENIQKLLTLTATPEELQQAVQILTEAEVTTRDQEELILLLLSLALIQEQHLQKPNEAVVTFRRIIQMDPANQTATEALSRLAPGVEQEMDLYEQYQEKIANTKDPDEKISLSKELAKRLLEELGDRTKAVDVYRQALRLAPDDNEILLALSSIFRLENRLPDLADILHRQIAITRESDELMQYKLDLAKTLEALDHKRQAAQEYQDILQADPANQEVVEALERLLVAGGDAPAIAASLKPYYVQHEKWDKASEVLEVVIALEKDASKRMSMLLELADLQESKLGQSDTALLTLMRALRINPERDDIQARLEATAAECNKHDDVARLYMELALALPPFKGQVLWIKAAEIFVQRLRNYEDAAKSLIQAVGAAPQDVKVYGGAKELWNSENSDQLLTIAQDYCQNKTQEERLSVYKTLARGSEEFGGQQELTTKLWSQVQSLDESDEEAQASLERLAAIADDPSSLANQLIKRLSNAEGEERLQVVLQLSDLKAKQLEEPEEAIAILEAEQDTFAASKEFWVGLINLYKLQGKHEEQIACYNSLLSLLGEGNERLSALSELAAAEFISGKHQEGLNHVSEIFNGQAGHLTTITMLESVQENLPPDFKLAIQLQLSNAYVASKQYEKALPVLEQILVSVSDAQTRSDTYLKIADIQKTHSKDAASAYTTLEKAFTENPRDNNILHAFEEAAGETSDWESFANALKAALNALGDESQAQAISRRLAEVLEQRLGRVDEAIQYYKAAGAQEGELPEDMASLEALERLLRQQENPVELAPVLERMINLLPDEQSQKKRELLVEVGNIYDTQIADAERAAQAYERALEYDSTDMNVLSALQQIYERLGQFEKLTKVLNRQIELSGASPQVIELHFKQAEILANQLNDQANAVVHYRTVLMKKRNHEGAIEGLETLLPVIENKQEIALLLEPIYTAKQDHEKLAWVLELKLEGTEDQAQRKSLLRRIGDIYENRLDQKVQAFIMARRALGEDPADMGVRMWIEKLANETDANAELAEAYVEEAKKAEPKLAIQFHRRAAAIFHEKIIDFTAAVEEYRSILAIEPKDEKALSGLEGIFRQEENYADLAEVLVQRAEHTIGMERRREILNELAEIYAEKLMEATKAVNVYKQILGQTPDDVRAYERAEQLLQESSSWEPLSEFYDEEITRLATKRGADPRSRRQELLNKRAQVLDLHIGDTDEGTVLLRSILEENPSNQATWQYLEARIEQGVAAADSIAILEEVYSKENQWEKYSELLEKKLERTPERDARREIYKTLSKTQQEKLNSGDRAFMTLCRAFDEDRGNEEIRTLLEEVAGTSNSYEDLAEVYAESLDTIADQNLRLALTLKLGELSSEKLQEHEQAIVWYQKALDIAPNDLAILADLDAMLTKVEKWADLTEVLEKEIELIDDATQKAELLNRLAMVWNEHLYENEAALRCYNQVLEIDPENLISLRAVEKIFEEVDDWDNLADNLKKQASIHEDPKELYRIHKRYAELAAEEFTDYASSIEHWQKVIELQPTDVEAQKSLEVLFTSEEMWDDLAEHYRLMLVHAKDESERAELFRRLGVILGEKLGRSDDALQSWEKVLETEPRNLDALRALQLIYLERAMWDEFIAHAETALPLVETEEAQTIRYHLTKVYAEQKEDQTSAIKYTKDYLRFDQNQQADQLQAMGVALELVEGWAESANAYGRAAELTEDQEQQLDLFLQAANVYRDKLQNEKKSIEFLEGLREVRPDHPEAFDRLRSIFKDTLQWRKLVSLIEEYVNHAPQEERYALLCEIRDIQNEQLGEKELAFIAACRAFSERPTEIEAANVLETLGEETDGLEEAVAVLEDEVDQIADPAARVEVYRKIASIYADKLEDVPSAEEALQKLQEIAPDDLDALDFLAALGSKEERYDKQIQALEHKLNYAEDTESKKAILYHIARAWEESIGDVDEAIDVHLRVLELDPQDRGSLEQLKRIYEAEERWENLVETLSKLVELATDLEELVDNQLSIARIYEGKLNQPEDAIRWYNGILEVSPTHKEALEALENLYTTLEHWRELIQIFELQLNMTEETEDKVLILGKMASIYEGEFESYKDAVTIYERVLQVDSSNLKAIINIERLLRQVGEWSKLIEIYEHHITLCDDSDEIVGLHLQIAEIYYKELSRVDKAEEIYNKAREVDSKNADALLALSQLYERSGNWFMALDMLQQGVDVIGHDKRAVRLLYRMGKINEEMLLDTGTAKSCYERALDIDDSHMSSLGALREIARNEKDWERYVEYLVAEAENCDDDEERTELYFEAAEFFRETRGDEEQAAIFYEKSLAVTPDYLPATHPLAEICFRNENWERASELYNVAVSALDPAKDTRELAQKHYRLGYIAQKIGDDDGALNHYQEAFELDPTYLPALEGLAQALLKAEAWEEAQKVFQTILIHHRDSLTEAEVVDVQYQLGDLALKLKVTDRAIKQFEKALEIDPDHPDSLKALARLARDSGKLEDAYKKLLHLTEVMPLIERVPVYIELSELCRDHLNDLQRAIDALEQAKRIQPENVNVLIPLGEMYHGKGQMELCATVYEDIVRVSNDAQQKCHYHHKLAEIYRDHLNIPPKAVENFNYALDADHTHFESFEAIEQILAQHKQWGILEENYRMMIQRTPKTLIEVRTLLWRNLGQLYNKVLKNLDGAIMAYEVVVKIHPDSQQDQEILASLYAQKPEHRHEAIRIQHEALEQASNPVQHARELKTLYHADENFDAVYCMCQALAFLGEATEEEIQIFQYLGKGVPQKAAAGLTDEMWKDMLYLPGVKSAFGDMSIQLLKLAPDYITFDIKQLGLKKKERVDLRGSMLLIANMFKYVARLLGSDHLNLFVRGGSIAEMAMAPTNPLSISVGEASDLLRSASQKALWFHLARNMAFARPELYLARAFPGDAMVDLLYGMMAVYNPALDHSANPREVDRWAGHFAKVPQQYLRRLQDPLRQVYPLLAKPEEIEKYQKACELTANRVGYLVCNALDVAVKAVNEVEEGAFRMDTRAKVKDILVFSLSRNYLKLRQAMGLGLRVGKKQGEAVQQGTANAQ